MSLERPMSASLAIQSRLPYRVEREDEVWVASCDVLDVVSQGDDREDAGRMLAEALQLFLEGCLESGTLDDVLSWITAPTSRRNGCRSRARDHGARRTADSRTGAGRR